MPATARSYRFTDALVRTPARSVTEGLRAVDIGAPDPGALAKEHAGYLSALEAAGLSVHILPALEDFPDSVFVEDPVLCLGRTAVLLRPGAASRLGEVAAIEPALGPLFPALARIEAPGFVDGGDLLLTERELVIGLSQRTDAEGARQLADIAAQQGLSARQVAAPAGVLHLKSACAVLDEETLLVTKALAESGVFSGYRCLVVPEGEDYAANAVRVNDMVLLAEGYPATAEMLVRAGYQVIALPTVEVRKLDAGLSCMSLRFTG